MEWIKRRGDDDDGDEAEDKPVKRRWEKTGLTWLKRRNTPTSRNQDGTRLAEERRDAADNWARGDVASPSRPGLASIKKDRVQKDRSGTRQD